MKKKESIISLLDANTRRCANKKLLPCGQLDLYWTRPLEGPLLEITDYLDGGHLTLVPQERTQMSDILKRQNYVDTRARLDPAGGCRREKNQRGKCTSEKKTLLKKKKCPNTSAAEWRKQSEK